MLLSWSLFYYYAFLISRGNLKRVTKGQPLRRLLPWSRPTLLHRSHLLRLLPPLLLGTTPVAPPTRTTDQPQTSTRSFGSRRGAAETTAAYAAATMRLLLSPLLPPFIQEPLATTRSAARRAAPKMPAVAPAALT